MNIISDELKKLAMPLPHKENDGVAVRLSHHVFLFDFWKIDILKSSMSKKKNNISRSIKVSMDQLMSWIENEGIKDEFIIPAYGKLIDKLNDFVHSYGSFSMDFDVFQIIQNKIESIADSSEISSDLRILVTEKFNISKQITPKFLSIKKRRKFDQRSSITKAYNQIRSKQKSLTFCCGKLFKTHTNMHRHIVKTHPDVIIDGNNPQEESTDTSQIQGTSLEYSMFSDIEQSTSSDDVSVKVEIETDPEFCDVLVKADTETDSELNDVLMVSDNEMAQDRMMLKRLIAKQSSNQMIFRWWTILKRP
ncbi:hypothetical protein DERF_006788 [Dermatophagoides farinae]|uniref:Uncharacterized protein n=1 Tax=Dermatophagoides farinae TaxID=6954 RepID=A0A922I020_DERFA|nr:hypothetical protein DERF_006788 [Dermatophagoides farinae]